MIEIPIDLLPGLRSRLDVGTDKTIQVSAEALAYAMGDRFPLQMLAHVVRAASDGHQVTILTNGIVSFHDNDMANDRLAA